MIFVRNQVLGSQGNNLTNRVASTHSCTEKYSSKNVSFHADGALYSVDSEKQF